MIRIQNYSKNCYNTVWIYSQQQSKKSDFFYIYTAGALLINGNDAKARNPVWAQIHHLMKTLLRKLSGLPLT